VVSRTIFRRVGTAHRPKSWYIKTMGSVGGAHPTKKYESSTKEAT
jgi:hypothetical protein